MENAGGLKQLHVLTIMARSHQNRMMLLSVGCLPALMRLMKLAIMRLNTLGTPPKRPLAVFTNAKLCCASFGNEIGYVSLLPSQQLLLRQWSAI
jgi:hypothetical protein